MARRRRDLLLTYTAASIIFFSLCTIFGSEVLVVQNEQSSPNVLKIHERGLSDNIEIAELKHENKFQKSIKSCIPVQNKKCKEFVPLSKETNEKRQRVGLLSPPGDMSLSLQNRLAHIILQHNQHTEDETPIDLVATTNVPPYGYGKSHGYTKIIRVTPQPLLLQVTDALTASLTPGETHRAIETSDVRAATRMILRWHCRLSHVAAHTAMYSVPLLDFIHDSGAIVKKLEDFVSPHLRNVKQRHRVVEKVGDDDVGNAGIDDDETGMMEAEFAYGNQILRDLGITSILQELDKVLQDEIQLTNSFSKWPCPSFWDHPEPLSDLGMRLARNLSPNCDDPFAQCFVERDKCEFRGDASCEKKKKK